MRDELVTDRIARDRISDALVDDLKAAVGQWVGVRETGCLERGFDYTLGVAMWVFVLRLRYCDGITWLTPKRDTPPSETHAFVRALLLPLPNYTQTRNSLYKSICPFPS